VALALGYNKKSNKGDSTIEMYCQACIRQPNVMRRLGAVYDARELVSKPEKQRTIMSKIKDKLCEGCLNWTRNYRENTMLTLQPVGEATLHNNLRDMQEEIMDVMTVAVARQQQDVAHAQAQAAMLALPPVAAPQDPVPAVLGGIMNGAGAAPPARAHVDPWNPHGDARWNQGGARGAGMPVMAGAQRPAPPGPPPNDPAHAPPPPPPRVVPEVVEPLQGVNPWPAQVPMRVAQTVLDNELRKLVNYLKYKGVIEGDWDDFDGMQGPGGQPSAAGSRDRDAHDAQPGAEPEAGLDGDDGAGSTAGSQAASRRSTNNSAQASDTENGADGCDASWSAVDGARVDPQSFDLASNASGRSGATVSTARSWLREP